MQNTTITAAILSVLVLVATAQSQDTEAKLDWLRDIEVTILEFRGLKLDRDFTITRVFEPRL